MECTTKNLQELSDDILAKKYLRGRKTTEFRPLTDVQIQGYDLVPGKSTGCLPLTLVKTAFEKKMKSLKNATNNLKINSTGRGK